MNIFVRNRSKKGHQKGAHLCTKNVSTFGTKRGHPGIWVGPLAKSEGPQNGPKNVPRFRVKKVAPPNPGAGTLVYKGWIRFSASQCFRDFGAFPAKSFKKCKPRHNLSNVIICLLRVLRGRDFAGSTQLVELRSNMLFFFSQDA